MRGCNGFDRDWSRSDKQAAVPETALKNWDLKINAKTNKTAGAPAMALAA